jgi:hypothetical protein
METDILAAGRDSILKKSDANAQKQQYFFAFFETVPKKRLSGFTGAF